MSIMNKNMKKPMQLPFNGAIPQLASYPSSINTGVDNRAWYQTYVHALDIAAFIPSVTIRSMTNDVFTEWEDVI